MTVAIINKVGLIQPRLRHDDAGSQQRASWFKPHVASPLAERRCLAGRTQTACDAAASKGALPQAATGGKLNLDRIEVIG
jgi:hypothetical protein